MVASNNAIDNTVGASISGVTNTFTVTNPSNTASSAARETIIVGGGTAGDPTINWNVSGVTNWEAGIDNSDSDKWKLSTGTALGTTDSIVCFTNGEVLKPRQPAFLGYLSAQDNNVTGDGTAYRLGSGNVLTKQFDQGNNLNVNGIFTAPVTGIYNFTGYIHLLGLGVAHTAATYSFGTPGTNDVGLWNPAAMRAAAINALAVTCTRLIPLNAGATCQFGVQVNNSTKTVNINAPTSYFCGWLVC